MKQVNQQRPLIFYILIVMVIMLILNATIFPMLLEQQVVEVDYGTFIQWVNEGTVSQVKIEDDQITFLAGASENSQGIYKTGVVNDDKLVDRLLEAGVEFGKDIPQQMSPILSFILSWILPIGIFMLLGVFMMRMMNKMGGGANSMQFGKSNAKVYVEAQTGKTFADVAGQEEAKDSLKEVVDYLHNPAKYQKIGAMLPKGVLLVGPPGTGKTLLAKAVAGEAKVPFFSISGSEFVEMFVGMGAARVRDLFKQAQEKAPCIVFIDEIDAIGKSRNSQISTNDEREQTLNQLLTEMDGFDGSKGVVLLAATNRPESLDSALTRPGRFDRRVQVELPDLIGRVDILKVHAKNVKVDDGVDYNLIARATSGASGADLANIVNEAALRAVRMKRDAVSQEDLEESVEVIIAGQQKKNSVLTESDRKIVSYHEIGHALVAALMKGSSPVHKITIVPRTSGALGYTMQVDEHDQVLMSREQLIARITSITGGRAAEQLVFNSITTGAANDIEQATRLARAMVTRYGMSEQFGMMALETPSGNQYLGPTSDMLCSPETQNKIDVEVKDIITKAYEKAVELLSANMDKLTELSTYLLEKETITGAEFMEKLGLAAE